jgi:hypothetical protein
VAAFVVGAVPSYTTSVDANRLTLSPDTPTGIEKLDGRIKREVPF